MGKNSDDLEWFCYPWSDLYMTDEDFIWIGSYTLIPFNLCRLLMEDFINCDIPYFIEFQDRVYLNAIKTENCIAQRQRG